MNPTFNTTIDVTQIIVAIIGLLSAIITYRIIPWIKANTTEKQQAIIRAAIQTAVYAAEQLYGAGHGQEKYDYAVDWLKSHGYDVDKAEIEAAVYEFLNDSGVVILPEKPVDTQEVASEA